MDFGQKRDCQAGVATRGLIVWWALALCLSLVVTSPAEEYFVGSGPIIPNYMGPFGAVIYELDTASGELTEVWALPEGDYFSGVKVYYSARVAVIVAEPWGYKPADRLYLVPFDSVSSVPTPILDFRGTTSSVSDCNILDNGDGKYFLKVSVGPRSGSATLQSEEVVIDLSAGRAVGASSLSAEAVTRLAGPGTSLSSGPGEARRSDLDLRGDQWIVRDPDLQSHLAPIPDSIIRMKTSYSWNLIADEPAYCMLNSVPDRGGLTSSELLILDRATGAWRSMLIPGAVTRLRQFGTWLGGVVMDPDPARDYEKRFGGPPVPREDVVLVNPVEQRLFTAHLGADCGLLSIDNDDVYYRVDLGLYRARIQDDDLVDRELLVHDLQVAGLNWAFSVGE